MSGERAWQGTGQRVLMYCYVNRNYDAGTTPQFYTDLPAELEGRVTAEQFATVVDEINSIFVEAETLTAGLCCLNFASCLTGYLLNLCIENPYEKHMRRLAQVLESHNNSLFHPNGIHVINPMERGLRILEVQIET
eukprot:m.15066 g.15066  ORF g.15066 m.15066 type:complete len:136 (+) comp6502_c0_seq2:331-738(+)